MTDGPRRKLRGAPPAGLCDTCGFARVISNRRGSEFLLCQRAGIDPGFERYPRLPVLACAGYQPVPDRGADRPRKGVEP